MVGTGASAPASSPPLSSVSSAGAFSPFGAFSPSASAPGTSSSFLASGFFLPLDLLFFFFPLDEEDDEEDDEDDDEEPPLLDDDEEEEDDDESESESESESLLLLDDELLLLSRLPRFFPLPLYLPSTAAFLASYSALGSGGSSPVKSANFCRTFGFFSCCVRLGLETYTLADASVQHSYVHLPNLRHRWHWGGLPPAPAPDPPLFGARFTNISLL